MTVKWCGLGFNKSHLHNPPICKYLLRQSPHRAGFKVPLWFCSDTKETEKTPLHHCTPRPLAPRLQTSIRETPGYWITQYHGSPGRVLICRSQKISAVMLKLKDIRRYRFPLFECCSKNYRTLRKDIFTILKFNVHSKMTCTEAKSFQSEGKQ